MVGVIRLSYWLGVLAALLAFLYRALVAFGLASGWPVATATQPRNFLQLAALLFVFCLATEVYARNRTS